jgi:quercetin dioxygenase-like cupin family protein
MKNQQVTFYRWEEMPRERVSDTLDRRLITADRMMLAHVYLKKGTIVPRHAHENEQITYILEGGLRFWIGEDESEVIEVRAGEVLHIPSMVQHKAEALEDTLDVDIFSPPRQDWLDKTDDYLRQKKQEQIHHGSRVEEQSCTCCSGESRAGPRSCRRARG